MYFCQFLSVASLSQAGMVQTVVPLTIRVILLMTIYRQMLVCLIRYASNINQAVNVLETSSRAQLCLQELRISRGDNGAIFVLVKDSFVTPELM